jgi:hypothetical protein
MAHDLIRSVATRVCLLAALGVTACATPQKPYDYGPFLQAKPASLLVLPPLSEAPDVKASHGVWAHATRPLAEAGYYVLPITLVDETFKQNGLTLPAEVHEVPIPKLREFFGADAAVYMRVLRYGTSYAVVASETVVEVEARVVDLRDGRLLWQGKARASSAEQQQQTQGGLAGLLIAALAKQIVGTATDAAFNFSAMANQRLLGAPRINGVLLGPRSPNYGQPPLLPR